MENHIQTRERHNICMHVLCTDRGQQHDLNPHCSENVAEHTHRRVDRRVTSEEVSPIHHLMQHITTHTYKEHMARYLIRSHDVCHCDGTNKLQYDEVPPHAPHYVSLRVCQKLAIWRGTSSDPSSHENPTVSMVGDMARYLLIFYNTCHYHGADVGRYAEVPPHVKGWYAAYVLVWGGTSPWCPLAVRQHVADGKVPRYIRCSLSVVKHDSGTHRATCGAELPPDIQPICKKSGETCCSLSIC
jgi:hypothetical protein